MSLYQFQAANGCVIEREFCAAEVPDAINVDGRTYLPLFGPSPPEPGVPQVPIVRGNQHNAHSAPRQWATNGLNPVGSLGDYYDKWGKHGVARVEGQEDERRLRKAIKTVFPRHDWQYDP